ncbi:hypothetical protein N9A58_08155 [Opitutales bacterium]|nr:hypothetical protein [Opitutales bacterium]
MPAAPHTHFWKLALLLAGTATLFSSCGEDPEVRSYTAANHYEGPVVSWVMPEQWGENPGMSGMMAGSFHIKTSLGPRGRIGVMPFRESVETTQIVNMFARELGHPDYNESSVQPLIAHKELGDRSFEVIRLEDMSGEEDPPKTALLALYRHNAQTWLFPFIADRALIDKELENFYSFLQSTTLRAGKTPVRAIAPSLPPAQPASSGHQPTWEAPEHWERKPATQMRVGNYAVSNEAGEALDFSITSFPGEVGGILANVNRWLGQVGMSPTDEQGLSQYLSDRMIDEKPAKLVLAESDEQALYAAILLHKGRSWFLKLMGDVNLARAEKENFLRLIDSFCLGDH